MSWNTRKSEIERVMVPLFHGHAEMTLLSNAGTAVTIKVYTIEKGTIQANFSVSLLESEQYGYDYTNVFNFKKNDIDFQEFEVIDGVNRFWVIAQVAEFEGRKYLTVLIDNQSLAETNERE